jgi:hypothetical protein
MTTAPLADPPAMPSAPPGGVRGWLRRARAVVWGAGPPPAPPATTDRGTLLAEQRTEYAAPDLPRRGAHAHGVDPHLPVDDQLRLHHREGLRVCRCGAETAPRVVRHVRSPATLGLAPISIGTLALVFAVIQHWQTLRELHARGLAARWSLALTVATFVAVLGVYAFGSLVLHY